MNVICKKIKDWYEGEYIPYQNEMGRKPFFIPGGRYRRHWTANAARWLLNDVKKDHMRWLAFIVSVLALILGFRAIF